MTDHPLARLLLYTVSVSAISSAGVPTYALRLTAAHHLTRLTARPAEFFSGLVADRPAGVVVASLYTGVLVVVEVGLGAPQVGNVVSAGAEGQGNSSGHGRRQSEAHGKGKRRASGKVAAPTQAGSAIAEEAEEDSEVTAVFAEVYEIKWVVRASWLLAGTDGNRNSIREHNLLSLAFLRSRPSRRRSSAAAVLASASRRLSVSTSTTAITTAAPRTPKDPTLLFLYLTPKYTTHLLARRLSRTTRAFDDLAPPVDLLADPRFLVPAAKRLVGLPGGVAVIGDEWTAEYEMGWMAPRSQTGAAGAEGSTAGTGRRASQGGSSGAAQRKASVSSNATAQESVLSRSPENKRRKGSAGGSLVPTVGESREPVFAVREGWRVRQGFGAVTT